MRPKDIERLRERLLNLKNIPNDFERKEFNLNNLVNWKPTQYRFLLHYASPSCLHELLNDDVYEHFVLFFVASRILCCPGLAASHTDYARSLLRKFVDTFQSVYGDYSQDINCHNLVHVADDVEKTNLDLTQHSAFAFESCLGSIKNMIRGKTKPLQQIVRRIAELHACPVSEDLPEIKHPLTKKLTKKTEVIVNLNKHSSAPDNDNVKNIITKEC